MENERVIHVDWAGPFRSYEMANFDKPEDKGLYQIYMHHPLYGFNMVYIGKTEESFAIRPSKHKFEKGSDSDRKNIVYYIGRLLGYQTPDFAEWKKDIQLAEMLLIHSHAPAYNSTNIDSVAQPEQNFPLRILNWGDCRSLQREVSGLMWSRKRNSALRPFGSATTSLNA